MAKELKKVTMELVVKLEDILIRERSAEERELPDEEQLLLGISFFIPSAPFPPKARGRRGFDGLVPPR